MPAFLILHSFMFSNQVLFPSLPACRQTWMTRSPPPGYTKHHFCLLQCVKIINHCQLTKLRLGNVSPHLIHFHRTASLANCGSGAENRNEASSHLLWLTAVPHAGARRPTWSSGCLPEAGIDLGLTTVCRLRDPVHPGESLRESSWV